LSIGQHLFVSDVKQLSKYQTIPSEADETELILHQVKPGETLYQIARDYNATIKQLMEWNEKSDFNLRVGEELKIRKSL
jgi:membrane-bound lytic murein transglycosylase D